MGSKWRDIIIESSSFSTSKLSDCIINRVVFKDCRLQGTDFNTSDLTDVVFINCNLSLSNFRRAKLLRVRFEGCSMTDADFMATNLREVEFDNCELDKVNFSGSIIKNVDLSGSQISNIIEITSLKGVTIDSTQLINLASELASTLGIKVK